MSRRGRARLDRPPDPAQFALGDAFTDDALDARGAYPSLDGPGFSCRARSRSNDAADAVAAIAATSSHSEAVIARIRDVYRAKQLVHVELAVPLTWNGFLAICRRERVKVGHRAIGTPAALIAHCGRARIVLNSDIPPRRHTYFGAHELGHWWLHAEHSGEPVYYMGHVWTEDAREDEAELMAQLLLGGPRYLRTY